MIDWLHDLPTVVGAGFVIATFLVPTLIGSIFLQPVVGRMVRREKDRNVSIGLLLNAFTLYYGVLLALLSIAVFENYNKAQDAIGGEATSIVALYRNLVGYPEPARTTLIGLLRQYIEEETGPGWRQQRSGRPSEAGRRQVEELNNLLVTIRPEDRGGDDALHRETLRSFDEFVERRRARVQAGTTSIPAIIWYVVLIGAAMNVFILWLFDLSLTTHLILGGVLISFIGLVIYMVAALDQPFRGAKGLSPDYLAAVGRQLVAP